jgi:hypothetical protein
VVLQANQGRVDTFIHQGVPPRWTPVGALGRSEPVTVTDRAHGVAEGPNSSFTIAQREPKCLAAKTQAVTGQELRRN